MKLAFSGAFTSLELVTITVVLLYLIGGQAVMSVLFLCCLVPYVAGLSTASTKLHLRTAAESDRRIFLMSQVASGIHAIKTYVGG